MIVGAIFDDLWFSCCVSAMVTTFKFLGIAKAQCSCHGLGMDPPASGRFGC